jgi:hypothetical protein
VDDKRSSAKFQTVAEVYTLERVFCYLKPENKVEVKLKKET